MSRKYPTYRILDTSNTYQTLAVRKTASATRRWLRKTPRDLRKLLIHRNSHGCKVPLKGKPRISALEFLAEGEAGVLFYVVDLRKTYAKIHSDKTSGGIVSWLKKYRGQLRSLNVRRRVEVNGEPGCYITAWGAAEFLADVAA